MDLFGIKFKKQGPDKGFVHFRCVFAKVKAYG